MSASCVGCVRSRGRTVAMTSFLVGGMLAVLGWTGAACAQQVSFNPSQSVPVEPIFTLNIDIDCAGQLVKGTEVSVAYDPFLLHLDFIAPGSWYTASGQANYFFDYTPLDAQGVIHFASAVLAGTLTGQGTVAVCHFSMVTFGTSPLIFQTVDVRGGANQNLGFGHSVGDNVLLDPVVPVQGSSFGAIKAIYR